MSDSRELVEISVQVHFEAQEADTEELFEKFASWLDREYGGGYSLVGSNLYATACLEVSSSLFESAIKFVDALNSFGAKVVAVDPDLVDLTEMAMRTGTAAASVAEKIRAGNHEGKQSLELV